jgi:tetratricopeptide (TPR) repeat protein
VFVFDDTPAIVDNPHIRTLWPLTRSMSAPPEVTVAGRPIAAFTLAVNFAFAALDVGAETQLRAAVALDESSAPAQLNLGVVLSSAGKFEEGIARLERALALDPANTQVYGNLGEAHAAQGRVVPAAKYFLLAVEARPDNLFLLNRAGWPTEALRLARMQRRADIIPEIEARLSIYRAGQPFRQQAR